MEKSSTFEKRIAQGIGVISFLMLAVALVLELLNLSAFNLQLLNDGSFVQVNFSLDAIAAVVLGLLILSRQPGHGVGRLLLAIGFLFSWFIFSTSVGGYYDNDPAEIPSLIRAFVSVGSGAYLLALMIATALIPLYFPDGRLLSPRWRPVSALVWTGMVGLFLNEVMKPEVFLMLEGSVIEGTLTTIFLLGVVASLVSLVLRFTRSRGDERTQMKWLVYTAVVSISLTLLMFVFQGEENFILLGVFASLIPTYLAIAIGIAILRHRLWDIDIIIRRTLSYALLTGLLALAYYGGLVILQTVAGALIGESDEPNNPIFIVLTTLGLAALFNPLRTRIQSFIDRRFFRRKYDAEQTLARFAATARDEVELDNLAAAMLKAVDESLQPERISLWLDRPERAG